ncbi:MAG: ABC transporter permease [Puniceicoccaceae bacterium]
METFQHKIVPRDRLIDLRLREIWQYRDLLYLFVRRDFVAKYKQTILGPLWFFVTPLLQTVVYSFVFGTIAELPTSGLPSALFYLSGITCWSYFSICLTSTSNTFTANASIFGKVYFPRAVTPISIVISNLIQFAVKLLLFLGMMAFYVSKGASFPIGLDLLFLPLLVLLMGMMGLGFGMIISSMTTKYRDMNNLIVFGTQLLMYATPVIYPLDLIEEKSPKMGWLITYNPMSSIIEAFRHMFLGTSSMHWDLLLYSSIVTVVVFLLGLIVFNRTEKNFMDTV